MNHPPDALAAALAGRYTLERELGAGGMATVYLAHDARHERRVALKVLKPELAAVIGAERFLAEIKTTANLQHPHILALFDSGEVNGTVFYVMPYVEGESLRDRLMREKQLPVDEAVRIAREVADALDYAHRHGVVHRDIKPENILLHDGRAVVADFGIALAVSRSDGGTRMTETGMSLGTPHYMSPEQAMGEREITPRSDVYALGCVLYEMLAGEPPFTGPTPQAIVARVLTEAPRSLIAQRRTVPPHVEATVRRSLEKLPADRFQTALQFAEALAARGATAAMATEPAPSVATRRAGGVRGWLGRPALPWAFAGASLAVAIGFGVRGAGGAPALERLRFSVDVDQAQSFPGTPGVLVTPDSRVIIAGGMVGQRPMLIARHLDQMTSAIIPGSEGASRPFLSPDGKWVAYAAGGKLMKLPIEGGTPVVLGNSRWGGGSWNDRGEIVYPESYQGGLWVVNEAGGTARKLTDPDTAKAELAHWWPQWLPDGQSILFTAYRTPISKATIEVLDTRDGSRTVLVEGGVMARLLPSGSLVFARDEALLAVPFDAGKRAVTGSPIVVVEGVFMNFSDGFAAWDVSPTGMLAYMPTTTGGSRFSIVEVDRRGNERPVIAVSDRYSNPRWSPDRQRISFDQSSAREAPDVWVYDLARASRLRVTSDAGSDFGAAWTPDGRDLIYMSERPLFELHRRAADASRPPEPFLAGQHDRIMGDISAATRRAAFLLGRPNQSDIWTAPLDAPARAEKYLENGFQLGHPTISPDGKWMAYDSDESGRMEVYVQSFPDPTQGRSQVSSDGGTEPAWSKGGREIVLRKGDSVLVAAFEAQSGKVEKPTVLFVGPYDNTPDYSNGRSYDVTPDGERFLMLKWPPGDARRRVSVVTDWFAELRERMPR